MEEHIKKRSQTHTEETAQTVVTTIALALFGAIPVVYYLFGFEAGVITALMCAIVVFALK